VKKSPRITLPLEILRSNCPLKYRVRLVTYGVCVCVCIHKVADKSLARPTSPCIFFDGEYISFDASLVIYINSTNIPPIMIINRTYEHQNLLSL
jgi:hypothetical protein